MRDVFFERLYEIAKKDPKIILILADTGGFFCEKFSQKLKKQFLNVGIAEQNVIGIAAGLALAGKTPFVFNILPFAALRCYEQIRIDLCCMSLSVSIVGTGAGFDYNTLGPTHHGTEDIGAMRGLPGMTVISPSDDIMAREMVNYCVKKQGPKYLRLERTGYPFVYDKNEKFNIERGFNVLRKGKDVSIVATGRMVMRALELAKTLSSHSINAGVIDLFKIKPIQEDLLCEALSPYEHIAAIEEHFIIGGLGSAVLETLSNNGIDKHVLRLGIPDKFCRIYGNRFYLQKENCLDLESLEKRLIKELK
jgi:transketolase